MVFEFDELSIMAIVIPGSSLNSGVHIVSIVKKQ